MLDVRGRGRILPQREGIQGNLQATRPKCDTLSQHHDDECGGNGLEEVLLRYARFLKVLESGTLHEFTIDDPLG